MRLYRLQTVDAAIVFDLNCATSAGGTRLAPDVTDNEAKLLARAMTYKYAILGVPVGGAKAVIRALPQEREQALRRYCAEILPLVEGERFLTSSDLGTHPEDFVPLGQAHRAAAGFDIAAIGVGALAAAHSVLGKLTGVRFALEGFGKVGAAVAAAIHGEGARLVAVSTRLGAVRRARGFDVTELLALRDRYGDQCVQYLGESLQPVTALFDSDADVLIPGARVGTLNGSTAARVRARVVAPVANAPYTAAGLRVLRERGVVALPDFVCNCGAALAFQAGAEATAEELQVLVVRRVAALTRAVLRHDEGPFAGACVFAADYLRTWIDPGQLPVAPPLA
jgi:glutamate dehydrogenase/leucine dehydrogenase